MPSGGGGSDIIKIESVSNSYGGNSYNPIGGLPVYNSSISGYGCLKTTINGKDFIAIKNGLSSSTYYMFSPQTNSYLSIKGSGSSILNAFVTNTTLNQTYYFNCDYFDFSSVFPYFNLNPATKTKPTIVSLVLSTNPETDFIGTDVSLTYYSGTPPSNTMYFFNQYCRANVDIMIGENTGGYGGTKVYAIPYTIGTSGYVGFKTDKGDIAFWFSPIAGGDIWVGGMNFSQLFPNFYS